MDFFFLTLLGKPLWLWLVFTTVVGTLLLFDLGILHRKSKEISIKESLLLSGFYIAISLVFGLFVWHFLGSERGIEYFTGYLVEKTLSIDNIFVISLIFSYLAIPPAYQHRVLFWGILGVVLLRALLICLGATLVASFSWTLYLFALFLLFTGIKMLFTGDKLHNISDNPLLKYIQKYLPTTHELHGQKFAVKLTDKESGKAAWYATPLLVALLLIEFADVIFAVDSVPAIFTITLDTYVVYTSNIFAILGLRALYFALAAIIHRFKYLKQALAWVLIFIGSKLFIADFMGWEKFPAGLSLGITGAILLAGVAVSLVKMEQK